MIIGVLPDGEFAAQCAPHIDSALTYNPDGLTCADLWDDTDRYKTIAKLENGAVLGCAVVTLVERAQSRYLHVIALAGERFQEWDQEMVDTLKMIARDENCDAIEWAGRIGWARHAAKRYGAKVSHAALRIDL